MKYFLLYILYIYRKNNENAKKIESYNSINNYRILQI